MLSGRQETTSQTMSVAAARARGVYQIGYVNNQALSVYLGHFQTVSHGAARQAVAEIIAADSQNWERGH